MESMQFNEYYFCDDVIALIFSFVPANHKVNVNKKYYMEAFNAMSVESLLYGISLQSLSHGIRRRSLFRELALKKLSMHDYRSEIAFFKTNTIKLSALGASLDDVNTFIEILKKTNHQLKRLVIDLLPREVQSMSIENVRYLLSNSNYVSEYAYHTLIDLNNGVDVEHWLSFYEHHVSFVNIQESLVDRFHETWNNRSMTTMIGRLLKSDFSFKWKGIKVLIGTIDKYDVLTEVFKESLIGLDEDTYNDIIKDYCEIIVSAQVKLITAEIPSWRRYNE